MVKIMGGVLMKSRTRISYVVLKYDDETDSIYTKLLANDSRIYEVPSINYRQKDDATFQDLKSYLLEKLIDVDTIVDENHIFIPYVQVSFEKEYIIYNYIALVLESKYDFFTNLTTEAWNRVEYDRENSTWQLPYERGIHEHISYRIKDYSLEDYHLDYDGNDDTIFTNVMHFISETTKEFPILGLMAGNKFTMKQVLHYQDLLGMDALKAGNNATFESQYANSIQTIQDNHLTTSYKIKNEFLQK